MKYIVLLIFFTIGCASFQVRADTGLVMRCDSITVPTQAAACKGSRTWVHPGPTDYILSLASAPPTDASTISWNDPNLQFRQWNTILGNYGVTICTKDLSSSQVTIPVGGADQCAPAGDNVLKPYVPASTVAIVPPTVLNESTATLSWPELTKNEDGSALTDLKGYNIYEGNSTSSLAKIAGPITALTYVVSNLSEGTYYFAVTGVNAKDVEGDKSISNPASVDKQVTTTKPGVVGTVTVIIKVQVP